MADGVDSPCPPDVASGRAARRFGRDARLLTGAEYQRVFAKPQRIPGKMLMVLYRKREPATGPARLGLAISRKHARRAVDRNRIKRVAREAFRACGDGLPPVDLVVLSRTGAGSANRRTLRAEFDQLLGKLK